jgi:hypothetical protein
MAPPSRSRLSVTGLRALAVLAAGALAVACVTAPAKKQNPDDSDTSYNSPLPGGDPDVPLPENVVENSGAFGPSARPARSAGDGGADAGDAGPATLPCSSSNTISPGDLAIVELMIDSRSGMGDPGEWVEIRNQTACPINLQGITVESPRGAAAPDVAKVDGSVILAAGATFLAVDTTDATKNNGLTGTVIAWNDTDVLKNSGDTVSVKLGTAVIDSVTYPDLSNLNPGRSFAFPADCPLSDRSDWRRWSLTFTEYAAGLQGTPNAPNSDVSCF